MPTHIVARIAFVLLLVSSWLLTSSMGAAQATQPLRIVSLGESWGPTPSDVGLRDGLAELGYRENEHYFLGIRFTQGDRAALFTAARELVQYQVDLIFTSNDRATKAAQMATTQIPIVFASVSDPVGIGVIENFARPGGNITGVAELALDLSPKRLQVFQEVIPGLRRVLFPYDGTDADAVKEATTYREAARRLGIEFIEQPVRTIEEARAILTQVRKGELDGVLAPRRCTLNIPGFVLEIIPPKGIPTMFDSAFWVERGALVSYGQDFYDSGKQAARLVDKILKGAKPAEIPVEVNSKIELTINLKTMSATGLTIAPGMLYQADRIVR